MNLRCLTPLILLVAGACNGGGTTPPPPPPPPPPPAGSAVTIRGETIDVEIVRTDTERRGLSLATARPILIAHSRDRVLHLWTARGDAAFDVLWLDAEGRVLAIDSLAEDSDEGITSPAPVRSALLLQSGRAKALGAQPGDPVAFPETLRSSPPEPRPEIRVGGVPVQIEVSSRNAERMRGLMHRRGMAPEDGMLFIYAEPSPKGFWMGNCHFPLDIAFFDENGAFLNVVAARTYPDPKIDTGERARSDGPAKYVLEVNLGWFRRHGLVDDEGKPMKPITLDLPETVRKLAQEADY